MQRTIVMMICLAVLPPAASYAGVSSKAAREAAEFVLRKFGKEAEEGTLKRINHPPEWQEQCGTAALGCRSVASGARDPAEGGWATWDSGLAVWRVVEKKSRTSR